MIRPELTSGQPKSWLPVKKGICPKCGRVGTLGGEMRVNGHNYYHMVHAKNDRCYVGTLAPVTYEVQKQIAAPNLSEVEWAYLAGIVDGEGTISIKARKSTRGTYRLQPRIMVCNTDYAVIDYISKRWSKLCTIAKAKSKGEGYLPLWRVEARSFNVYPILMKMKPYLVIKEAQALCLLEFLDLDFQRKHNAPNSLEQVEMVLYLRKLNMHGKAHHEHDLLGAPYFKELAAQRGKGA